MGRDYSQFGVLIGSSENDLVKFCFQHVLDKETLKPVDIERIEQAEDSKKKLLLIPYSDIDVPSAVLECNYSMDSLMETISGGFIIKSSKLDNLRIDIDMDFNRLILTHINLVEPCDPPVITPLSQLQKLAGLALSYKDAGRCYFDGNDPEFILILNGI